MGVIALTCTGSGFAQSIPSAKTITHVKSGDGHFDKLGPGLWTWTANGKHRVEELVEDQSSDDSTLRIKRSGDSGLQEVVSILPNRQYLNVRNTALQATSGTDYPITEMWFECSPKTPAVTKCTCDLTALRPLQGAAGLGEVAKKTKDVAERLREEIDGLEADPIKVVRGPDDAAFVTDHHHGALAFLGFGRLRGTCEFMNTPPGFPYTTKPEFFFLQLDEYTKIRLKNGKGERIAATALPRTLREMPDDPYRTLAWMVRKRDGYCRSKMGGHTDFAEFQWADWLRTQPTLPLAAVTSATSPDQWHKKKKDREESQQPVLDEAVRLAMLSGRGLPGYRAATEVVESCNPSGGD
jgi:hypothetical protein